MNHNCPNAQIVQATPEKPIQHIECQLTKNYCCCTRWVEGYSKLVLDGTYEFCPGFLSVPSIQSDIRELEKRAKVFQNIAAGRAGAMKKLSGYEVMDFIQIQIYEILGNLKEKLNMLA